MHYEVKLSLYRPLGLRRLRLPEFLDNRYKKAAPAAFTPQDIPVVLISVRG